MSNQQAVPIRRAMQAPVAPELEDCCRSGCNPCVFDLYEEALTRYEAWLAAQADPAETVAPPHPPGNT